MQKSLTSNTELSLKDRARLCECQCVSLQPGGVIDVMKVSFFFYPAEGSGVGRYFGKVIPFGIYSVQNS